MKKVFPPRIGLVLLCISIFVWGVPIAQACDKAAERFWSLMEGVNLSSDQYRAISDYVYASPIQFQNQLCSSLKSKREEVKAELLKDPSDSGVINAKAQALAGLLNELIANQIHFLAFLPTILTPTQLDIFRGNALDMALEMSKDGNILLRIVKIGQALGLPSEIQSQLGDDFIRFLQGVIPLRTEMAGHGLDLMLTIRKDPRKLPAIDESLAAMASLRTKLVFNRVGFLLHMRNLIGVDKMAIFLENLRLEFNPDEI